MSKVAQEDERLFRDWLRFDFAEEQDPQNSPECTSKTVRACSSSQSGSEALQNDEVTWPAFHIFAGGHSEGKSKTNPAIIRYA